MGVDIIVNFLGVPPYLISIWNWEEKFETPLLPDCHLQDRYINFQSLSFGSLYRVESKEKNLFAS